MDSTYIKFLEHLDIVLRTINNTMDSVALSEILIKNNISNELEYRLRIGNRLYHDGYVIAKADTADMYIYIKPAGDEFIANGGYIGQYEKQKKDEKAEQELRDSTIESNKTNVRSYKWNIRMTILNVFLTIANIVIAYLAFTKSK